MTCLRCEKLEEALRELVRVVSHQLARGEDPEEGAFDRAWVAACVALSDEEPVAVRSDIGPGQPTPSITMDTTAPDPAPSVCSVCGVGAGKHKPDCSRPPAPSAEPRMFPIMGGPAIPWGVIAPHDRQAKLNHGGQSLVRLAERGGLSPSEAVAVLEDRKWRAMSDEAALARLKVLAGWLPPDEVERCIAEARDEALEEAAKVADRLDDLLPMSSSIPDAIRALKSKKEGA